MDDFDDNDMPQEVPDVQNEEAPSGALPLHPTLDAQEDTRPSFDQVIDRLPKDKAAEFLKLLNKFGVDHEDPLVTHINILLDTKEAGDNALSAASRIEAATRGVGDQIYQTTVRAAADLKGVINADIRQNAADVGRATANAILVSINKGTEKIQEVVADLDKIAQEKGAQFAASWRAQAARAGEEQAKAALQKAIAIRWGVVTMTITISIVAGALIATGFADWTGHLLPWKWALITNPQGLSECGLTRGYPHNPMCWVRSY